ncbi:MAG: hypothetical protein ABSE82_07150 [Nitrososphaerales archaeon]
MFLKASADYNNMVTLAERCLRDLLFVFQRSGTVQLSEFEIIRPAYFRVVIEPNRIPKTWNFLLPSITAPKGSTIEIRFGTDSTPEEATKASENVREFLRALTKALPEEPWKGLHSRESAREEKRWKEQML